MRALLIIPKKLVNKLNYKQYKYMFVQMQILPCYASKINFENNNVPILTIL